MLPDNDNRSCDQHTPVSDEVGQAASDHNQPQQTLGQPEGPASIVLESPIPGYRLKPEIAQGGMGIVYSAECLTFGREVAVKVMKAGMSAAVFNREAQITARLPHPGIPPVHALGTLPDGRPYLVMKLIKGETLDSILKKRSDFSSDRGKLVAVFEHICQAVGFAHAQGIIHRDLKPSNVMVGAFGEVQVMDWGLAREVRGAEEIEPETVVTDQSLTMAGQIKGTPEYMAPEQARGEELDARADVFALGGMLAAILTGRPPFSGNSVMETIARAVKCDLGETLSRLDVSGADPELLALCRRCLEARREDRPADGTELAVAVAEYRAEVEARLIQAERERAAEAERLKRRRTQWALAGTAGLLILAGLFGIVVAYLWRSAESNRAEAEIQRDTANNAKADADVQREKLAVFEYGGAMRVAHQEWRDGNLTAMGALLDAADPKLRGWEWRYLNRLRDPSLLSLNGHTGWVQSAQFSSDGNRIVTASYDNTAKVWDSKTGVELLSLKGHTNLVCSAQFSPDGNRIVTAGDNTAKVWDAKTGKELISFNGHTKRVNSARFSPDGNRIVTASDDATAKIWDAKTAAEIFSFNGHTNKMNFAQFSADGNRIVTANGDTAKVWDAKTGKELLSLKGHTGFGSAEFSADGKCIVTANGYNTAKMWDADTGAELMSFKGHTHYVVSAQFSPDGNRIVTASRDKIAKVWDAKTGAELLSLKGHTDRVDSAQFSPDGNRIVTAGYKTAKVWDTNTGAEMGPFIRQNSTGANSAHFSSDGNSIVTANIDKTAKVWDAKTVTEFLTLNGHTGEVNSAHFSPDGNCILTASKDNTAKVWDAKTGAELLSLKGHTDAVYSAQFSPDGNRIVTASNDNTAKVWDAITGNEFLSLKGHTGFVWSAQFSPDGNRIVTASRDDTAKVWDAKTGAEIISLNGHTSLVHSAQFSPDGNRIVTASFDGTAKVWDAKTCVELLTLKSHTRWVLSAEFSPDGNRIVTASLDSAKVWDAKTGAELLSLKGHTGWVQSAEFSPDGNHILTADADGIAIIWDARPYSESFAEREAAEAKR